MLNKLKKIPKVLREEGLYGVWWRLTIRFGADPYQKEFQKSYKSWFDKNFPSSGEINDQRVRQLKFKNKPLISILTPTYNTEPAFLKACISSVLAQSYDNWELCIVDDASTRIETLQVLKEFSNNEHIRIKYRDANGHISASSNDALAMAKGEWVALLDHDDVLWPNALFELVSKINEHPTAQFIYSDEDKIAEDGNHCDPFFKPDWSPFFLWSCNYITHFACIKTDLIRKVNGFRHGTEGSQDWDLFLRITDLLEKKKSSHPWRNDRQIYHIDSPLYSWRKSPSSTASEKHSLTAKDYVYRVQETILNEYFETKGGATILPTQFLGIYDVKLRMAKLPLVSIIIPTKDQLAYLKKLIYSLEKSTYSNIEVILVDTGSSSKVINYYKTLDKQKYRLIKWNKPFNFSAVCNYGASHAKGEVFVFMNNDTEVITFDWLEKMIPYALLPNVGAVGPRLLYENERIQNNGLVLCRQENNEEHSVGEFVAPYFRTIHKNQNLGVSTVLLSSMRNYTAVTGAVLMIEKKKHHLIKGWNVSLAIAFNDVDYCLKLNEKYFFNLIVPSTELRHYESSSVGKPSSERLALMQQELVLITKLWPNQLRSDFFFSTHYYLKNGYVLIDS